MTERGIAIAPDHVEQVTRSGVWLTDLSLLLMATIWGVNFISVKYGTRILAPLAFNGVRVAIAAIALVAIVLVTRRAWPARRDMLGLLALGALGNGIYQIVFVEGVARTRAGDAALVLSAAPAFIAIIARMRGAERVSQRGVLGIVLSIIGIGIVVYGGTGDSGEATVTGDVITLGAALCWSLYTVLLQPYTTRVEGITLSAVTMTGGAIPMLAVAAPGIVTTNWRAVHPMGWAAILYSGLLALALAYLFWYRGIRVIGPTKTAMYANLQPIVAVLVGWLVLAETPGVATLVGGALVIAGLLLTRA